ncbi:MAG: hypothetical protein E7653_00905 [Ruminococcaceae bacterium]|nr:hypothetical protein [Oscillospiraceae bacterium]
MNEKWFSLSLSEVEKKLKTNAASGLSRKAARSAWNFYSQRTGSLFIKRRRSTGKMLSEIFSDFALIMLLIAALLCLPFEEKSIGVSVILVSVISVGVSFVYYYRSQRSLEEMQIHYMPTAKVIRGGKLYCVASDELVPGDVMILEKGDVVCADARLVTSDRLRVFMRTDKNKYVSLNKQSNGTLPDDGNDPTKLTNIIHAGSIIENGSARAIVYAVGKYTYLGAKTGGIFEQKPDITPKALTKIKKVCSIVSFISMLCILPFCVISLVISRINGGTSILSSVFLTALAITASSLTQLTTTLCRLFYARAAKLLLSAPNPIVIRTAETLDRLSSVKYVFMLDGCAVTDGVLHYDGAYNVEGEIKQVARITPSLSLLFEAATLYNIADNNSVSVGILLPNRYKTGLSQFLAQSNVDVDALNIRCQVRSFSSATITDPVDRVYYTDRGFGYVIEVSEGTHLLSSVTHSIVNGTVQALSNVGVDKLRHTAEMYAASSKKVLIFTRSTLSANGALGDRCFVGAVVLCEKTDIGSVKAINELKKRGVSVISFIPNSYRSALLDVPADARPGVSAQKADFVKQAKPITYKFGEIGTYYGLNDFDICELINHVHSKEQGVAVIAFSDTFKNAIKSSDVFISCSDVNSKLGSSSQHELEKTDISGEITSMSCVQTVRSQADILIRRPSKDKRGGLMALVNAFAATAVVRRNLSAFFTYAMSTQLLRICMVALPMLFGETVLDARHIAICGFVIDMLVLLMFALDKRPSRVNVNGDLSIRSYISNNKPLWISTLVASIFAIVCPLVVDYIGFMGPYLYETEYLFCSLLWLHPIVLYFVRFGGIKNIEKAVKDKAYLALCAGIIVFVALIHLIEPLGALMKMTSNPIAYFVLSFIPIVIFGVTGIITGIVKKK